MSTNKMDSEQYLARIMYEGGLEPSYRALAALQAAHLHTVPFENLDIHLNRPITLDLTKVYKKVVEKRRGGFCYELNGLFGWLLGTLGYEVTLLTARVVNGEGELGHPFDHLALMVTMNEKRWLVDVGFGHSFEAPLEIDSPFEQSFEQHSYQWLADEPFQMLRINKNGEGWQNRYQLALEPQTYEAFAPGCHYHQTSPKSSFTQGRLISQAHPNGRITLTDEKLIETWRGERHETAVTSHEQFKALLKEKFGLDYKTI